MSVVFVKRFDENENATSITFKKYSTNPEDIYPTFSICFKGDKFHWYYDLDIYNVFELTSEQYQKMLKGKQAFSYQYEQPSRLYSKIPSFLNNESGADSSRFRMNFCSPLIVQKANYKC